jgi:hypothetical protein
VGAQHDQRIVDEFPAATRRHGPVQPAAKLACASAGLEPAARMAAEPVLGAAAVGLAVVDIRPGD